MAARKQIGIIYIHSSDWVGGNYYIQNLIAALHHLPEESRPQVTVFTTEEKYFGELSARTCYNYLTPYYLGRHGLNIPQKLANKITRRLVRKNIFYSYTQPLDIVFPGAYENVFSPAQHFLYWIPDFQEAHLPHLFSAYELDKRQYLTKEIIRKGKYIVLSSESAKQDFNNFYPGNGMRQWVMPFAVSNDAFTLLTKEELQSKYNLPDRYFLCSNQFWQHKNQKAVLDALRIIKQEDPRTAIHIVFTGKEDDYRDSTYFPSIKQFCTENNLEKNVSFLGFISREDQLSLMSTAEAVVQPSLFEGWSTVVEDGKSLNARVIASDLDVHKEQLTHYPNGYFFDKKDNADLAKVLLAIYRHPTALVHYDYNRDIRQYAERFITITDEISKI